MENDNEPLQKQNSKAKSIIPIEDNGNNLHETEHDHNTLEPQNFGTDEGIINIEDPEDLKHWASEFQISSEELKSSIFLVGPNLSAIRKYLSV